MKIKIITTFFFLFVTIFLFAQSVDATFFVPSSFTPNGDGTNDSLKITGNGIKKYAVKIYDRWGEMIVKFDETEIKSWDGKFKGKEVVEGVYIWRAEVEFINGKKELKTGSVTLIR